jgi:hypothetical protein
MNIRKNIMNQVYLCIITIGSTKPLVIQIKHKYKKIDHFFHTD